MADSVVLLTAVLQHISHYIAVLNDVIMEASFSMATYGATPNCLYKNFKIPSTFFHKSKTLNSVLKTDRLHVYTTSVFLPKA